MMEEAFCVLGLPFHGVTLNDAAERINHAVSSRQRCFLTTPNLNFLINAQSDDDFLQSVIDSDLIVADGLPIVWVANLLGIPLTERVAGSDLFDKLSKQKSKKKIRVFFFGGQEGIAEKACQALNKSSEGMLCSGFYDPGFVSVDEMSSPQIIDYINATNPDFIVVALGSKKGQEWIQKNRLQLIAPVISHLGAVINFVAGNIERAPVFWQRCGVEWLWRIYQEPALWRRYYSDGIAFLKLFLFDVLPYWFWQKCCRKNHGMGLRIDVELIHQPQRESWRMRLSGVCRYQTLADLKRQFINFAGDNKDVVVDLQEVAVIDGAFIGQCMLLNKYLALSGHSINLINANKTVRRILKWNKASYLLKCT